jgi:hypothetical protein
MANAPITCESCKGTDTRRYENAGGLKMYACWECGWHHEVPAHSAGDGEKGLREALEALQKWEHWYSVDSTEFNRDTAREEGLKVLHDARYTERN